MFPRMHRRIGRTLVAACLLPIGVLTGCRGGPLGLVAPDGDGTSPQSRRVPVRWARPAYGPSARPMGLDDVGSKTFSLHAAEGGSFKFGRYTLIFPPNAVAADADITIDVPNGSLIGCNLSISPETLNGFLQPVSLIVDCGSSDVTRENISDLTVFWDSQVGWFDVGGLSDSTALSITTQLRHFSDYRAGW